MRIPEWKLEEMTVGEKLEWLERFFGDFKALENKPMKVALEDMKDMQMDGVEDAVNILDHLQYDLKDNFPTRYTQHEDREEEYRHEMRAV